MKSVQTVLAYHAISTWTNLQSQVEKPTKYKTTYERYNELQDSTPAFSKHTVSQPCTSHTRHHQYC